LRYRYVDNTGNPLANEKQSFDQKTKVDVLFKKMREEKFLISHNKGYDSFYLILGGDELKTENDELDIAGKVTTGKLVNAFMKMNKRKAINRVLVSKFIQGMAV
jgi:UDP-2,3-diacylglucosamine pyrophosphatase LpxH